MQKIVYWYLGMLQYVFNEFDYKGVIQYKDTVLPA